MLSPERQSVTDVTKITHLDDKEGVLEEEGGDSVAELLDLLL